MLTMFVCMLVNSNAFRVGIEHLSLDEMYDRLFGFLYQRYTNKYGISFDERKMKDSYHKLGKIALEGIAQNKFYFQKRDILREAGPEVFKYGILIGNDDLPSIEGSGNDSQNIHVYFPHKTMQEYLAAEYLSHALHHNESTFKGTC